MRLRSFSSPRKMLSRILSYWLTVLLCISFVFFCGMILFNGGDGVGVVVVVCDIWSSGTYVEGIGRKRKYFYFPWFVASSCFFTSITYFFARLRKVYAKTCFDSFILLIPSGWMKIIVIVRIPFLCEYTYFDTCMNVWILYTLYFLWSMWDSILKYVMCSK